MRDHLVVVPTDRRELISRAKFPAAITLEHLSRINHARRSLRNPRDNSLTSQSSLSSPWLRDYKCSLREKEGRSGRRRDLGRRTSVISPFVRRATATWPRTKRGTRPSKSNGRSLSQAESSRVKSKQEDRHSAGRGDVNRGRNTCQMRVLQRR